jgi:hypothetical protein
MYEKSLAKGVAPIGTTQVRDADAFGCQPKRQSADLLERFCTVRKGRRFDDVPSHEFAKTIDRGIPIRERMLPISRLARLAARSKLLDALSDGSADVVDRRCFAPA